MKIYNFDIFFEITERELVLLRQLLGEVYAIGRDFLKETISEDEYDNLIDSLKFYIEKLEIDIWQSYKSNISNNSYLLVYTPKEFQVISKVIKQVLLEVPNDSMPTRIGAERQHLEHLYQKISSSSVAKIVN